jgi:cysteine-rich repeat protein
VHIRPLEGEIAELRIFDGGFNPGEVVDDYNSGCSFLVEGVCGDGVVSGNEECDGGDDSACPGECLSSCVCQGDCGNGSLEIPEECDDGGNVSGDGCSEDCQLEDASATDITSTRIASGLYAPVHLTAPPLDTRRLFIIEQRGTIRIMEDGMLLPGFFLDIQSRVSCCGERGLLSLAFHPEYANNGRFFVNYTNNSGDTRISRFEVTANPHVADHNSEIVLLTIDQPFSNHNGGQLAFGPDGYLYVGMGDGGSAGDPIEAGQDDSTLLAKLLRMDVDVETTPFWAVPPSNPGYVNGSSALELIWAKGLRNPWRFAFDRETDDLLIADVGQYIIEEVDYQPASSTGGENYGWDIFEGTACFEPAPYPDCPDPPIGFTHPILQYTHSQGACSITGGHVYRGCALPDLHGTYFYSDYCVPFFRTFEVVGGAAVNQQDRTSDLASTFWVSSFGEDARGEIYILSYGGDVYRIVPAP